MVFNAICSINVQRVLSLEAIVKENFLRVFICPNGLWSNTERKQVKHANNSFVFVQMVFFFLVSSK